MEKEIEILYAPTLEQATLALEAGYEPVECSFGRESVVGEYVLDHHGKYSAEEAVSTKAAKLASDGIKLNRFVVTGAADTDQMYAVAALAGAIPIRMEDAEAIAEMDVDPIGRNILDERYVRVLLHKQEYLDSTNGQKSSVRSLAAAIRIFSPGDYLYAHDWFHWDYMEAILREKYQRKNALGAVRDRVPGKVALVSGQVGPAWNDWYTQAPIVVAYVANQERVTVGLCPKKGGILSDKSGFDILGDKGLLTFIPSLNQIVAGWGGRPDVIGSPRNQKMSLEGAAEVYEMIKKVVADQ
jgi:hypothetical protein